jgi:hypothetical protein
MATSVSSDTSSAARASNYRADQGFFTGISVGLSLLIAVGFAQLVVRGINDPADFPLRVHVHAVLLLSWLGLFSYQNWLAHKGTLAIHRKLGKASVLLIAAIIVANTYVTVMTVVDGRLGPQFTPGYFFALGASDTLFFAGLFGWALARKHDTQWHRRLMFGATLILSAAGFNRILSGVGPLAEPISIAAQLAFLAAIAWNDRRVLGHVHKATLLLVPIIVFERLLPGMLGGFPPLAAFANSFVG